MPYRDEFIEVREASIRNLLKKGAGEWRNFVSLPPINVIIS